MARANLRRIRPKEVALIADILAEPAQDVEELAKDVLRAINAYRASEPLFVRAVKTEGASRMLLYGPYPTTEAAATDEMSAGIGPDGSTYQAAVVPLHGPYGAVTEDHEDE